MSRNNFLSNPLSFTSDNNQIWAVKMKSYLVVSDLWDIEEIDIVPEQLKDPTIVEMRAHKDAVKRRSKVMTRIH